MSIRAPPVRGVRAPGKRADDEVPAESELPILVVAGILGQKIATTAWEKLTGEPAPDTAQRDVQVAPLLAAAVVEGTLYKLTRMGLDRSLRIAAARREGRWIGKAGDGE